MPENTSFLNIAKSKLASFWSFYYYPLVVGFFLVAILGVVSIWNGSFNKTSEPTTAIHGYVQWQIKNTENLESFLNYGGLVRDSGHYTFIAKNGDYLVADDPKFLDNFAFFPLYPMQIRLTHELTRLDYPQAVLLTGLVNTLLFCCVLYLTLSRYIGDKVKLRFVFLLACLLPFNYFFFVSYSESLFASLLLLIINLVIESKNSHNFKAWLWLLPVLSFLIALTRSPGAMVSVFLFVCLLEMNYTGKNSLATFQKNLSKNLLLICSILANIAGIVSFLAYGYHKTGNFWISKDVQAHWDRGSTNNIFEPILNFFADVVFKCLHETCNMINYSNQVYWAMALILMAFSLVVSFKYFSKTNLFFGITAISIVFFALPLTTNVLLSIHRLFIVAPIYYIFLPIFMFNYISPKYHRLLIIGLMMFFVLTASFYYKVEYVG
jgi:hypothetical protein